MDKFVKNFCCPSYLKEIDQAIDKLELSVNRFINNSFAEKDSSREEELRQILLLERKEKLELANACRFIASRLEKVETKVKSVLSESNQNGSINKGKDDDFKFEGINYHENKQ